MNSVRKLVKTDVWWSVRQQATKHVEWSTWEKARVRNLVRVKEIQENQMWAHVKEQVQEDYEIRHPRN